MFLKYKPNADEVIGRLKSFWRQGSNHIIVIVKLPNPDFDAYIKTHCPIPKDVLGLPDLESYFRQWDSLLKGKEQEDDDTLPVAYLHPFDQGTIPGCLGAEVSVFEDLKDGRMWSMSEPLLESWEQLPDLEFDSSSIWLSRLKEATDYFVRRASGRFCLGPIITIDGLNLAVALRGAKNAYLDIYDHPEELQQLMELGLKWNIAVEELQREVIGTYNGGVYSFWGGWVPNRTAAMSVDAYGLCDVWVYRELGRKYHQQMIDYFGGGIFHLHGNARHLLPELAKLQGVTGIYVGDDGASVRAFDDLVNIRRQIPSIPLGVDCKSDELLRGIEEGNLPGDIMYVTTAQDRDEARKITARAREYCPKI
jgi:hypothetical protein